MSKDEREEIIVVLMMRKNYAIEFLESQTDEQLQRLFQDIERTN